MPLGQATVVEGMPPVVPPPGDAPEQARTVVGKPIVQPVTPAQPVQRFQPDGEVGDGSETVVGSAAQFATAPIQLEVTIAGGKPVYYNLDKPRYTIGRNTENDIVISSPIVSRRQAVLEKV